MNDISIIDVGESLADAELHSYTYSFKENILIINIKAWNENLIEFAFFDPISFLDRGVTSFITKFCRNMSESGFLKQALSVNYVEVPENHPYKWFQFMNLSDLPALEIICDHYDVKIHELEK
jgi:hypothetical protein